MIASTPAPHGCQAIETFAYLRQHTAAAHAGLEQTLDLLRPPLDAPRFRAVLARFFGLHRVWEPAVASCPQLAPLMDGRSRLPDLHHDLLALGLSTADVDALPLCTYAVSLVAEPLAAWGSVYVMEGSTLGGKLIARALEAEPWGAALRYFDGRGAATGPMWRELGQAMDAMIGPQDRPAVADGAARAFDLVRDWVGSAAR